MKKIPYKYKSIVKTALVAAAAVGPVGVFGGIDAVAVGGIWTTMFFAIRNEAGTKFGNDPKRIAGAVASGIVQYYIGCKLATYTCFLIPGVGVLAAMGVSALCNIKVSVSSERGKDNCYACLDNYDELLKKHQEKFL